MLCSPESELRCLLVLLEMSLNMSRLSQPPKLLMHQPQKITEHYDQVQIGYPRQHYGGIIEHRLESGTIPTQAGHANFELLELKL